MRATLDKNNKWNNGNLTLGPKMKRVFVDHQERTDAPPQWVFRRVCPVAEERWPVAGDRGLV